MRGIRLILAAVVACALLAPADQELSRPRCVVEKLQVTVGRTAALAVVLDPPPARQTEIALASSDPQALPIPPTVIAQEGARYTFVPVCFARRGKAMLTVSIGGESSECEVEGKTAVDKPPKLHRSRGLAALDGKTLSMEAEDTPDPDLKDAVAPIVERDGTRVRGQWSSNQVVDWSCEIQRAGFYYFDVTGCCDEFLDAPECGVVLDGKGDPVARGRISSSSIEEFGLEPAVHLAAGKHTFSFRFLNDAYDPETGLDRNQYLDRMAIAWAGEAAPDWSPPRVEIHSPADGQILGGLVDVVVEAWDDVGVTEVQLHVNDVLVARATGRRLTRRVAIPPGTCRIQATARDGAGQERGRILSVNRLPFDGPPVGPPRWLGASEAEGMEARSEPFSPTGACLAMYASEPVPSFDVSWDREEEVEAHVLARADLYEGPPRVEVEVNGQILGTDVTSADYSEVLLGRVRLGQGDNHVVVRFPNDAYGGSADTDRNLFVAAVGFGPPVEDSAAPNVKLLDVPPALSGVEMILAQASDNAAVTRVDLLVDGEPSGSADAVEPFGLWVDTERLDPGRHKVSVRARDAAGNVATSQEVEVEVVRASHTSPLSRTERGEHLLNRLGLGYSREALERLLVLGEEQWIDRELSLGDWEQIGTAEFEPVGGDYGRLLLASLARFTNSRAEVRERLGLFWDNHFSTFVHKTHPQAEWNEYGRFRELALGGFRDLLAASAHSAAMLTYLDNQTNRRGHLNENYAREIMELHTLGVHGGYTQKDVEEVARVLTGWAADVGGDVFAYVPQFHDDGEKRALGLAFPAGEGQKEGEWLLDVLSAHPSTARFVCGKLAAMWVSDDPPVELLDAMVEAFLSSGGHIGAVLRVAVAHPAFFDRKHFATKVKDPLEFVMGLSRHGAWEGDLWALDRGMVRLGRRLYESQPPTGYKERAEEWLNSAALLTRWNLAEEAASRIPLRSVFPGGWEERPIEVLVDEAAFSLLGRRLAPDHRRLVLEALDGSEGVRRVRAMIALVLQMPEAQMN